MGDTLFDQTTTWLDKNNEWYYIVPPNTQITILHNKAT
jgi:hypothetical protein